MRMLLKVGLAAACAAGVAGTAAAAARNAHVMNVALPDGSIARVEYVGDVAPKVIVAPASPIAWAGFGAPISLPMNGFDAMFAQMDRQMAATMRQIDQMTRQPIAAAAHGANLAAYGSAPAGSSSYSVVARTARPKNFAVVGPKVTRFCVARMGARETERFEIVYPALRE